jgi:AraC family transcriptional regulator, regulatory protein of adaptative response / methylated-DNA-[protein]-cysteine methyltransferase
MSTTTPMIRYAAKPTKVGLVFAATTERGVCLLHLIDAKQKGATVAALKRRHPGATLLEDAAGLNEVFQKVESWANGNEKAHIALDLQGTAFQQKVWRALQRVPAGKTVSYSDLARQAGNPKAVRATASACARNPVALFVPCHRIVRRDGGLGGYAGGLDRKRRLLEIEGVLSPA